MITDGFTVDTGSFGRALRDLSSFNNKSQADNMVSFARTMLTNRDHSGLIDIMPPASQGTSGFAAKLQGERAIERDLSTLFIGVRLKHKRTEQHPDPDSVHQRLFLGKRPGSALRSDRGRQKYYVDAVKLRALRLKLKSHVGRLASAWLVAAHRLGVSALAWIERHGQGSGEVEVQLAGPEKVIEMAIYAPDNAPVTEIERRVRYAMRYTEGRVQRAVDGAVAASARKAGFRSAA